MIQLHKIERIIYIFCSVLLINLLVFNKELVYARDLSEITTIAYRNQMANDWVYVKRGYADNNCLAFALYNTSTWLWPWNGYPTRTTAKNYLIARGYNVTDSSSVYKNSGASKGIVAYSVSSNGITHFSRKYGNNGVKAKWGIHEIFSASTNDPYTMHEYGHPDFYAYKYK